MDIPSEPNRKSFLWSGEERRNFHRLSCEIPIRYKLASAKKWVNIEKDARSRYHSMKEALIGSNEKQITVGGSDFATNFSPLGMCIHVAAPIRSGIILDLEMNFQDLREKVEGLARVVWCKPVSSQHSPDNHEQAQDPEQYLVGLEFIATNNGIVSFIMQNIASGLVKSYREEPL